MNKETVKSYVMCPKCGAELFRATNVENAEICCRKCRRKYELKLKEGWLLIKDMQIEYRA